jgi:hypothetical protein
MDKHNTLEYSRVKAITVSVRLPNFLCALTITNNREVNANHVPQCTPSGETQTSPTPAPFFISDPSKYIVQYSWSTAAGGIWVSGHSATKLAST